MMQDGVPIEEALQKAKGQVTEALRAAQQATSAPPATAFFDALRPHTTLPSPEVEDADE
jgi:hypothetical protein